MAIVIDCGPLPPDDPIFSEGYTVSSVRISQKSKRLKARAVGSPAATSSEASGSRAAPKKEHNNSKRRRLARKG